MAQVMRRTVGRRMARNALGDKDERAATVPSASLSFFVPGLPTTQGNHRLSRTGAIYETTKGHAAWRRTVAQHASVQRPRWPDPAQPCAVFLDFFFPRPKRPTWPYPTKDLDKLARASLDAVVAGGLIADDRHVVELVATKVWDDFGGLRVTLRAREFPGARRRGARKAA